jgi:hypothetical protein
MGEVAHQRSEFVILTSTSPGLEEPAEIIQVCVGGSCHLLLVLLVLLLLRSVVVVVVVWMLLVPA